MDLLLQALASSLTVGAVYALIALGFSLILGTLKVVDFAYGAYVVLGAYVTWWSSEHLFPGTSAGEAVICIALAGIVSFALAAFAWGVVLRRLLDRSHLAQLVATLGLSVIVTGVLLYLFGTSIVLTKIKAAQGVVQLGPVYIGMGRLAAGAGGLAVLALAMVLLNTRYGLMIRAVSLDTKGAALSGIDVARTRLSTVAIGAGLGGLTGGLLILFLPVSPVDTLRFLLIAFFAVAMGGLDRLSGVFVASFFLAALENLSQNFAPNMIKNALPFLVVFAVIAALPQGFGNIGSMLRVRR